VIRRFWNSVGVCYFIILVITVLNVDILIIENIRLGNSGDCIYELV